ncbi:hypothetical protein LTR78_009650 [Recurvomyces mirabilis]|uniref:Glucose receptor Git3-like N-terminal domain-containing protein n=1 Tax=Recurvomyces mirabilis TaxID=574656 RepID=A0AAE0TMR6_9PEZI|nr:hypothetical protein LTR78_009650 [Recurvomyces mirabilis]KAK5150306.1 hypothetical protein LTS14_010283 [Recurvomyces mirabilis]
MPATHLAIAIPTFIGSMVSLLASTIFAIIYVVFPPKRHFRQVLICNLLLADWINSFNNTVSGIVVLSDWRNRNSLLPGPGCTANAYIGQFSVQAIDFNILVISIAVLITVRKNNIAAEQSWLTLAGVCAVPWIMPIITSNIGLGLGIYGPVTGNWCWITREHFGDRYALTHAWRLAIFVTTAGIYTWVYIHLKRIYGRFAMNERSTALTSSARRATMHDVRVVDEVELTSSHRHDISQDDEQPLRHYTARIDVKDDHYVSHETTPQTASYKHFAVITAAQEVSELPERSHTQGSSSSQHESQTDEQTAYSTCQTAPILSPNKSAATTSSTKPAYVRPTSDLRRMLLLNGYPILYILLWIPGIMNRVWEAFGTSPLWLQGLQATTQFMGFADVLTYAYNEQLHKRISTRLGERKNFVRSGD